MDVAMESSEFFQCFSKYIDNINNIVWGIPLITVVLLTGILLTILLRGLQIFHLPLALGYMVRNEKGATGEVSSLGAFCTALSATVGTGNIVGVATAITAGGPGALFWMWVAALFGMATKYAEGLLAVKYRIVRPDGTFLGGPFHYIERGLGPKWKFLAVLFAFFGAVCAVSGTGTLTQVQSITSSVQNVFDPGGIHVLKYGFLSSTWANAIAGLVVGVAAALVILGGLKRIAVVSEFVVPVMIAIYFLMSFGVLVCNYSEIPHAFYEIFYGAFHPSAVTGGMVGSVFIVLQKGVSRGIFSNEAGLGTAPIVAAAAQTQYPARQGMVCMTGAFVSTFVVCTMTGLTIVCMSTWNLGEGIAVTSKAFELALPFLGRGVVSFLLMLCLVFFAFTTCLGWSYYGERCLDYLTGGRKTWTMGYRWFYILVVFIAPYMDLKLVWSIADIFNGLMAFPNLIALVALSFAVVSETNSYFALLKKGKLDDSAPKQGDSDALTSKLERRSE